MYKAYLELNKGHYCNIIIYYPIPNQHNLLKFSIKLKFQDIMSIT